MQYFERARLELHPDLPATKRVQLGVLAPAPLQNRTFSRLPSMPSTPTRLTSRKQGTPSPTASFTTGKPTAASRNSAFP